MQATSAHPLPPCKTRLTRKLGGAIISMIKTPSPHACATMQPSASAERPPSRDQPGLCKTGRHFAAPARFSSYWRLTGSRAASSGSIRCSRSSPYWRQKRRRCRCHGLDGWEATHRRRTRVLAAGADRRGASQGGLEREEQHQQEEADMTHRGTVARIRLRRAARVSSASNRRWSRVRSTLPPPRSPGAGRRAGCVR